eukprot:TRINITY_DN2182_c0_g1_i1.p1 TRINITY_DN2182_c0_g1~~TRINITY_DN2182_c0_g1_i1.p1  ORF type:complete len:886 (+),score=161.96 TRINITY_DN2182_c0_g1_i1:338-2659(+)
MGERPKCTVMRCGVRSLMDPAQLVVGDIVLLDAGEEVPGDMRVLYASKSCSADRSNLTGSLDIIECSNMSTHDDFHRTENLLFYKTTVKEGEVMGVIVATGDSTEYGKILREHGLQDAMREHHPHIPNATKSTIHKLMKRWILPKTSRGTGALAVLDVLVVDCIGVITQKVSRVEHVMCDWAMYDRNSVPRNSCAFRAIMRAIVLCNTAELVHKKTHKAVSVEGGEGSSAGSFMVPLEDTIDPEELPVHGHHPVDGTLLRFYEKHSPYPTPDADSYQEERERWPRVLKMTLAGIGKVDVSIHRFYQSEEDSTSDAEEGHKKSTYQLLKDSVMHLGRSKQPPAAHHHPEWGNLGDNDNDDEGDTEIEHVDVASVPTDSGSDDNITYNGTSKGKEKTSTYDPKATIDHSVQSSNNNNNNSNNNSIKNQPGKKTRRRVGVPFIREEARKDNTFLIVIKGAPERIFPMCDKVLLNGRIYPLGLPRKGNNAGSGSGSVTLGSDEAEAADAEAEGDGVHAQSAHHKHSKAEEELLNHLMDFYEQIGSHFESIFALAQRTLQKPDVPEDYHFRPDPPNFPIDAGFTFLGFVSIGVPPYPDIKHVVDRFRELGTQIIMCSSFHPLTVKTIAKKSHIITHDTVRDIAIKEGVDLAEVDPTRAKAVVVHGDLLSRLEHNELKSLLLSHAEIAFARILPHQKAQVVKTLKELDLVVGVTGASVGDVQALKNAHVGIALHGAPAFAKDASDLIMLKEADCLQTIMNAINIVKNQKPEPCQFCSVQ